MARRRLVLEGAALEAVERLAESAGISPAELIKRALRREDNAQRAQAEEPEGEWLVASVTPNPQEESPDVVSRFDQTHGSDLVRSLEEAIMTFRDQGYSVKSGRRGFRVTFQPATDAKIEVTPSLADVEAERDDRDD